jgi:hypothetical protein
MGWAALWAIFWNAHLAALQKTQVYEAEFLFQSRAIGISGNT